MPLPPYDNFPELSEGKIALHQILAEDLGELIEISFYDAVRAYQYFWAVLRINVNLR